MLTWILVASSTVYVPVRAAASGERCAESPSAYFGASRRRNFRFRSNQHALNEPNDSASLSRPGIRERNGSVARPYPVGVPCFHWPPAIFAAAITACVRLSTPSFCRIAETCALMVASETPSS
ncbi:hypothetical protein ABIG06_003086 [Bradyrhizobium sp. USDA 326]